MKISLISNPPYNMEWEAVEDERFENSGTPPQKNANFAFIMTGLQKITDRAIFLLPCGVLSTQNRKETEIRKYLIENNFVESIVLLPGEMFEKTGIATCIVVFNKNKTENVIAMFDLRKKYDIETRKQRGQFGGSAHENRVYEKEKKIITEETMQEVLTAIQERKNVPEFVKFVTIEDVIKNKYNLSPARYIEILEKEGKHRPYMDIVNDLNFIIRQRNVLKLTINETVAKRIGLDEIAQLEKQSNDNLENINETLKKIGCANLAKSDYITLSKNKNEIKFENKDKEIISEIFLSIFQMYKAHIMFLNNVENKHLAELRDALLPDLMSGRIEI